MAQDRMPLNAKTTPKKPGIPYWRWLLAPMLLASVGLHGLILFAPVGPSEEELLPPPDPEEDGVAITKIDAPQPRPTATAPANAGTVKTAPPTSAAASQPRAAAAPSTRASSRANQAARPATQSRPARPAATPPDATGQTAPLPNLAQTPAVDTPNTGTPSVGGRATSGDGRNPRDRPNGGATAGSDPFEKYVAAFETYNGVKISPEDAAEIQSIWLGSFSDRGPEFTSLDPQTLKIFEPLSYESSICLPSAPAPAQLLVMVDADGTVDEYQPFIQRTGYRLFDNAAADQVRQHEFPTADGPRAYLTEVAVDYDPDNCEWPPQVDKLPDEYFTILNNYVGPTLTTPAEAQAAQENWLTSLRENGNIQLPAMDELTAEDFDGFGQKVPYPLEICLPLEPKTAEFGVVVQPDGSLSTEPVPLRSTGYQNFDDRAKALVADFDFPAADTTRLLVVEVPVDYNDVNCQPLDSESFEVPTTTAAAPTASNSASAGGGPAPDNGAAASGGSEAIAFNPALQPSLLENGRQRVEADAVGSLNTQLEIAAASLAIGWPQDIDQSCFLADLTDENFVPVDGAADAIILSESADFVPLTLSRLYQAKTDDAGEYCGAPLVQMSVDHAPQLLASVVAFGAGGSNALVVLWTVDPRET